MKIGIVGILNNPARSLNSHSAGWVHIVKELVAKDASILTELDDWNSFDSLIICHGTNYKPGSYNVIGGIQEDLLLRLKKIHDYTGKIYSMDEFDVVEFIAKRNIDFNWTKGDQWYKLISLPTYNRSVIGDSHSLSAWQPGYEICRNDGKTLYGFMRNPSAKKDSIIYFGNIDIRFHLCRQKDPEASTVELANKYSNFCLQNRLKPVCLLPVESETRKIPKSGMYKGCSFFGSQEQRSRLVYLFNKVLLSYIPSAITWPKQWYDDPGFFEREIMEPKQSVHIRPKFYKYDFSPKDSNELTLF
jgi:hypothetical protein